MLKGQLRPDMLQSERLAEVDRELIFTIMGKLSVSQRAVLSLKYLENVSLGDMAWIHESGRFKAAWYLVCAHIRLKKLLIINGCNTISLRRFMVTFGKFTSI